MIGPPGRAATKAEFLRPYSRLVTILPLGTDDGPRATCPDQEIETAPTPRSFRQTPSGVEVKLCDGSSRSFDVLYAALGCAVSSELATALGAHTNDAGTLDVDAKQQTSVTGIYAAGDVVSDLHQLCVAEAHAAVAATAIHNSLPLNPR